MTRATSKPLKRIVESADGDLIAEIRADTLTLRPKWARPEAAVSMRWGLIYQLGVARLPRRDK